ncbi:hypothetical protein [Tenacibaculum sp. IB213877]|uniref:hypothetical protein n=1 Tax=Tenacibaculum sp. IB213877 TaxID=3097351 RepID=UPI002A5AF8CA|nr:hypothetical protein [Tenacibaculum sp. IB213877]MDY0780046.1 hypothetical protein [Tenacibaculum sp. IB213877]
MKFFLTLFLIISSFVCLSQRGPASISSAANLPGGSNGFSGGTNNFLNLNTGKWIKNNNKKLDIEGTTYLFNKWNNVVVINSYDGKQYKLRDVNFNLKTNGIEAKLSDNTQDSVFIFNSGSINYFSINNKKFVKKIIVKEKNSFFVEELNNDEKLKLFKYYQIGIIQGSFNPMTQKKTSNDKFEKKVAYYIEENNKEKKLKEIRLSRSYALQYMKDRKSEIKSFVKKNNLSYRKEKDFIRMINYYNSL